uniref:Uncharacterized protein n=1 Tax=Virus NIOZ-UU157 TaxID=2763269 RepID=A0A7S9XGX2_9VIRU|nr:MAG: hypothetical protein NIOZUU157_00396 [Virus NIOZ-UU157]
MLGLTNGVTNTSYQWQPNMVSATMALWLRNGVGVTAAQWDDSSGNGRHITQAVGGNRAIVSGGGLDFESSEADHYDITRSDIEIPAEEAFMVFIVCDIESYDSQNSLLGVSGTGAFLELQNTTRLRIKTSTTGDTDIIQYASDTFATGEKALFGVQREAGSTGLVKVFKNGSLLPVVANASGDGNNTGAITFDVVAMRNDDRHFDGKIYEMIVYEATDLKAGEIDKINNYLINKHGL